MPKKKKQEEVIEEEPEIQEIGIEEVFESMAEYIATREEYETDKNQYEQDGGVSWDYHGGNIRRQLDEAKEKAENNLKSYIIQVVKSVKETPI